MSGTPDQDSGKPAGETFKPEGETFIGRWSRRKRAEPMQRVEEDTAVATAAADAQAVQMREDAKALAQTEADGREEGAAKLPADLPPVESLTPDSDFTRFMQPDVPRASRNAAMKKLFTDPHFNVMDGLDIYIDDYTKEDPIPESMLRELAQSKMLGLFDEKKEDEAPVAAVATGSNVEESAGLGADAQSARQVLDAEAAPQLAADSTATTVRVTPDSITSDSIPTENILTENISPEKIAIQSGAVGGSPSAQAHPYNSTASNTPV